MPIALKNVEEDFVEDLSTRYLQDLKHRMKAGEFGRATPCTLLRKCTNLIDIETLIDDL